MLVKIGFAEEAHEGEVAVDLAEVENHAVVQFDHCLRLLVVSKSFLPFYVKISKRRVRIPSRRRGK